MTWTPTSDGRPIPAAKLNAEFKALEAVLPGSLTASRAVVTSAAGVLSAATTTSAEIGYVNGVTSAIQTQLNAKAPIDSPTFTTTQSGVTPPAGDASKKLATTDWLPTPGPIGSSTPASGKFTTLEATGALTLDTAVATPANGQVGKGDTAWTVVGAGGGAPAYKNSVTAYTTGGYPGCQFRKVSSGMVELDISCVLPGASFGAVAFTLPAGYRPGSLRPVRGIDQGGQTFVTIAANGDVAPQASIAASIVLAAITFYAES